MAARVYTSTSKGQAARAGEGIKGRSECEQKGETGLHDTKVRRGEIVEVGGLPGGVDFQGFRS